MLCMRFRLMLENCLFNQIWSWSLQSFIGVLNVENPAGLGDYVWTVGYLGLPSFRNRASSLALVQCLIAVLVELLLIHVLINFLA